MTGGVPTTALELDNEEIQVLIHARRLRLAELDGRSFVYRSATDTSAAARRRKTHYDRMD